MTRVWSIASERTHSEEDCAEIEKAIVYLYGDQWQSRAQSTPVPSMPDTEATLAPVPDPSAPASMALASAIDSDRDSGYEASPSSATRLASFLFASPTDTVVAALDRNSGSDNLRTGSQSQDMGQPSLPFDMSSVSLRPHSSNRQTSPEACGSRQNDNGTGGRSSLPLPDVVNVRVRSANGHNQARRAASVSLPIDAETIRSVGVSLRRISEDFESSNSRTMLSSDCGSASEGLFSSIVASLQLSRRSLSSRFRSHRSHYQNGRQRSLSTNDATQQ